MTLIAVGIPVMAGAAGGLIKYSSLRARFLRVIDDEAATLNSLPSGTPAYVEMEEVVHRHVAEYARAVTREGRGTSRSQAWPFNLGAVIGLLCTVGGGSLTFYVVDGIGQGSLFPIYVAGLVIGIIGTAFGVLMMTLVFMGALSSASAIAWSVLAAEDLDPDVQEADSQGASLRSRVRVRSEPSGLEHDPGDVVG